jgi:hypothetical protein
MTSTGNDADTYGWDTAFAINFANANKAIVDGWAEVDEGAKNVAVTADDDPDYSVSAVLGPWQLTIGGDGKNIRMECPFASGVYTAGSKTYDLGAAKTQVIIEVGMQWVPNPGQFFFVVSGATVDGIRTDLDDSTLDSRLRTSFSDNGKPLGEAAKVTLVTKGEEWMITDGQDNFYIFHSTDKYNEEFLNVYQFQAAWANDLKALAQAASSDEPAVTIITISNNPAKGIAADVLPQLLSDWFNAHIAEFNHVFAALDLSPIVAENDKYAWMKPTSTSYAVTDEGTLDSSIFGVLTMALGRKSSNNHQVSPYAIPDGSDAGFLIAGPMFLQYMLLAGAQQIFNGASADSFLIENDGLTVSNTKDLVWGKFMMDEKKQGSVRDDGYSAQLDQKQLSQQLIDALSNTNVFVYGYSVDVTTAGSQWLLSDGDRTEYILSLNGTDIEAYEATVVNIAKGQFNMSLNHTYVEIEFIDLAYSYSSDFDVHVNYTEHVQLTLKQQGDKQIFWFDQILKNQVVSVTRTKAAITRQIVEGAVTAALSLVAIAGPIIEGLSAGADITSVTEDGGEAVINARTFTEVEAANPGAAERDLASSGAAASEQAGGKLTNIKNAFATPKWKFVAALAALAGGVVGFDQAISAIIEAAAKDEWENVPGFDDFAQYAIAPYTFPNVPDFTLKSAGLAGSLQVGLTVNEA